MHGVEVEAQLLHYYKQVFPVEMLFSWLRYVRTREFSFNYASGRCCRYITASTPESLRERLVKEVPEKMDIGAVYVHKPASVSGKNIEMLKELVLDIDLTDYERACCTDKGMCNACLPIIKCAVKVVRHVLEVHLGFEKILFVFSGGRGVHCWVSDSLACTLTSKDRANVAEYFQRLLKERDPSVTSLLEEYRAGLGIEESASLSVLYARLFPKLDVNVTKQMKHLLKSPFCIHPRTRKVCVPLPMECIDSLQLEDIPTLEEAVRTPEVLGKYMEYFKEYTLGSA
ncbi:DNA primase small subunit [Nematocida sp. AWRm77]|nr:DNA primase small subunit [Nematocida sp. AWRm77]